jgi:hypothetical protein
LEGIEDYQFWEPPIFLKFLLDNIIRMDGQLDDGILNSITERIRGEYQSGQNMDESNKSMQIIEDALNVISCGISDVPMFLGRDEYVAKIARYRLEKSL